MFERLTQEQLVVLGISTMALVIMLGLGIHGFLWGWG